MYWYQCMVEIVLFFVYYLLTIAFKNKSFVIIKTTTCETGKDVQSTLVFKGSFNQK